jgi:hypothetical protein
MFGIIGFRQFIRRLKRKDELAPTIHVGGVIAKWIMQTLFRRFFERFCPAADKIHFHRANFH